MSVAAGAQAAAGHKKVGGQSRPSGIGDDRSLRPRSSLAALSRSSARSLAHMKAQQMRRKRARVLCLDVRATRANFAPSMRGAQLWSASILTPAVAGLARTRARRTCAPCCSDGDDSDDDGGDGDDDDWRLTADGWRLQRRRWRRLRRRWRERG